MKNIFLILTIILGLSSASVCQSIEQSRTKFEKACAHYTLGEYSKASAGFKELLTLEDVSKHPEILANLSASLRMENKIKESENYQQMYTRIIQSVTPPPISAPAKQQPVAAPSSPQAKPVVSQAPSLEWWERIYLSPRGIGFGIAKWCLYAIALIVLAVGVSEEEGIAVVLGLLGLGGGYFL